MKAKLFGVLLVGILAFGLAETSASWGSGGGSTGGAVAPQDVAVFVKMGWLAVPGHEGWFYYYDNGTPTWAWKDGVGFYKSGDGGQTWVAHYSPGRTDMPTGVEYDKIPSSPPYSINGKRVSRAEALAAAEGIPDDDNLAKVVAIGDDAFLKAVSDDWEKAKDLHGSAVLLCYGPDNWWATQNGLEASTVLVAAADGTAKHLQKGYTAGDCYLFAQVFDPRKVPDVRVTDPISGLFKGALAWIQANQLLSLLIGGGIGYWLYQRNQSQ
jgi:hypothetical protein